jgi:hypothetical protein
LVETSPGNIGRPELHGFPFTTDEDHLLLKEIQEMTGQQLLLKCPPPCTPFGVLESAVKRPWDVCYVQITHFNRADLFLDPYSRKTVSLIGTSGSDQSQLCTHVYLIHVFDLLDLDSRVTLIYAILVNPKIAETELVGNKNGVLDHLRKTVSGREMSRRQDG